MVPPLVRCRVLEQLDVRAATDPQDADLVDHSSRVDVEQVLHEGAGRIADRPERERHDHAHDVLEPLNRLAYVGNREPDVVHPDEPQPAAALCWSRHRDSRRDQVGRGARRRGQLAATREQLAPRHSLALHHRSLLACTVTRQSQGGPSASTGRASVVV